MADCEKRRPWPNGQFAILAAHFIIEPGALFQLLTSRDFRRGSKSDELTLLQQIRETNADAGTKYLEHLVLRRRSQVI